MKTSKWFFSLTLLVQFSCCFPSFALGEETCHEGFFGPPECLGECHCNSLENVCDFITGHCTTDHCTRGWTDHPRCQTMCPAGVFGLDCSKTCHCPRDDPCNPVNGDCLSKKCAVGWSGPGCQIRDPYLSQAPSLSAVTDTSVTVRWHTWRSGRDKGEGPVAEYVLQVRGESDSHWQDRFASSGDGMDAFAVVVGRLLPGTKYWFRVVLARMSSGKSHMASVSSPEISVRTTTMTTSPFTPPTLEPTPVFTPPPTTTGRPGTSLAPSLSHPQGRLLTISRVLGTEVTLVLVDSDRTGGGENIHDISNQLSIQAVVTYQDISVFRNPRKIIEGDELRLVDLEPATQYRYTLNKLTTHGTIEQESEVFWTAPPDPPKPNPPTTSEIFTDGSAEVEISLSETLQLSFHPLFHYLVIVERMTSNTSVLEQLVTQHHFRHYTEESRYSRSPDVAARPLQGHAASVEHGLSYYITAEIHADPDRTIRFTVGDDAYVGGYHNVPLQRDTTYVLWIAGVTSVGGMSSLEFSRSERPLFVSGTPAGGMKAGAAVASGGLVAGLVVLFLLLILAAVGVGTFMWWRKRERDRYTLYNDIVTYHRQETLSDKYLQMKRIADDQELQSDLRKSLAPAPHVQYQPSQGLHNSSYDGNKSNNNSVLAKKTRPISVHDLYHNFQTSQKPSEEKRLFDEFCTLPCGFLDSTNVASSLHNNALNRSPKVLPYDRNRVKLIKRSEGDNPYINASFVRDLNQSVYIVTQYPLRHTIESLWQMVWEHDKKVLVVLMDLQESGKPGQDQFWPELGATGQFSDIQVETTRENRTVHYVIREFSMRRRGWEETHKVTQYQFLSWTGGDLPHNPILLVDFVLRIQDEQEGGGDGGVVMCHTGGGRSGLYIAVNSLIKLGHRYGKVDILKCANVLRMERPDLVKTSKQYRCIYECLTEVFDHRVTRYTPARFMPEYGALEEGSGDSRVLAEEFTALLPKLSRPAAGLEGPVPDLQFVSPVRGRNRRSLDTLVTGGADTIERTSLSYLDSFLDRDKFVVTSTPEQYGECEEFWQAVYENATFCVVMLNKCVVRKAQCCPSRPGSQLVFGPFTITNIRTSKTNTGFTVSTLSLRKGENKGKAREIHHYEMDSWPVTREVPSVQSFVDLVTTVMRWSGRKGASRPVMVHSSAGKGRGVTFGLLWIAMERLANEGLIDLFSSTRFLRSFVRPAVPTLEHYHFLYRAMREHLKRGDMTKVSTESLPSTSHPQVIYIERMV